MECDVDLDLPSQVEEHRNDSPQNRLAKFGAQNLSNTELVALLLGLASRTDDLTEVPHLTRRLFGSACSLAALSRCSATEIVTMTGMLGQQAALLVAAFELGRRVAQENIVKVTVDSAAVACQLLAHEYQGLQRESLRVLLLDQKQQLIRIEEISLGSLAEVSAHPRDIFRSAMMHGATSIIIMHNHPSGDPTPSKADENFTWRMVMDGGHLGIALADHIIFGGMRRGKPLYYSFKDEGTLF